MLRDKIIVSDKYDNKAGKKSTRKIAAGSQGHCHVCIALVFLQCATGTSSDMFGVSVHQDVIISYLSPHL